MSPYVLSQRVKQKTGIKLKYSDMPVKFSPLITLSLNTVSFILASDNR